MMRDYTEEELENYSKEELIQFILNMQERIFLEHQVYKTERDLQYANLYKFLEHHGMTRKDYGRVLYPDLFIQSEENRDDKS